MRIHRIFNYLDRYLGIPAVFLLGLCKRKKRGPPPSIPSKIGLLHTAAIGDTILLSGVIADLRTHFPQSEIWFFTGPSNFEAAQLIPGIRVVQIAVTHVWKSLSVIWAYSFDIWIDFGSWARINAVYSFFSRSTRKWGFQTAGQYRHFVYDETVLHQPIHELENGRNLIRLLGVVPTSFPVLMPLVPVSKDMTQIVIHLCAGGSQAARKEWPEEHWVALIGRLIERGYRIILTGGIRDFSRCAQVRQRLGCPEEIEVVAGKLSLRETALLLAASRAVISVDTGIMHLAAALGCLTLALHGPTAPERWGGIGPRVVPIVARDTLPCIHLGFESRRTGCSCMSGISPERVLEALACK